MPLTLSNLGYSGIVGAEALAASGANPDQICKDKVERVNFQEHIHRLCQQLLKRQEGQWKARYLKTLRTALYIKGHLGLYVNKNTFGFQFFRVEKGDPIYEMNVLEFFTDDVAAQLMAAEPKLEAVPLVTDDAERRRATRGMNLLRDRLDQVIFTEEHRQLYAKYGQVCGMWTAELFHDPDADDGIEWHEEYERGEQPGESYLECVACGATASGDDPLALSGQCPHCGGEMVSREIPPVSYDYLKAAGWKKRGEIVGRPVSLWAQRFSMTTGPRLSPWRYVERDLPREHVEALFGKLGDRVTGNWKDEWMHGERVLRRAEAYASGQEAIENDDAVLLQDFYLEPEMLCYLASDRDVELPTGDVIPAGERLSDVFEEGLVLTTAPGLHSFLAGRNESHRNRFQDGLFNVQVGEKMGRGNDAAAEYQRQSTVVHSMMYNHVRETARPTLFINERLAPNPAVLQRRVISVPSAVLADKDISRHFGVLQMPQISSAAPYLLEKLNEGMQRATKSFMGGNFLPGADNSTATGATIASQKQMGIHVPFLANFAQFKRAVITRGAELAMEHYGDKRLLTVLDGKRSTRVARELAMSDVRDYAWLWIIKPGSVSADIPAERQQRLQGALNAAQIAQQIGRDTPEVRRQINETYDVDLFNERLDEKVDRCLDALEAMKAAFEQGEADPLRLYWLVPVDEYELGAEARINFWRETLSGEEGYQLPNPIRLAIRLHIEANAAAVEAERVRLAQAASIGVGLLSPLKPDGVNEFNGGEMAPAGEPSAVEQDVINQSIQGGMSNGKRTKANGSTGFGNGGGFGGFAAGQREFGQQPRFGGF